MNPDKTIARLVGIFYILATAAGLAGVAISEPMLDDSDYLVKIADNTTALYMGAFLTLVMAVAVACIGFALYPVLRKRHPSIGIAYVSARVVEAVIFIIVVTSMLSLVTLSEAFTDSATPDAAYFKNTGDLLLSVSDWAGHVVLDVAVFSLGAMLLNYVLYRARLIPEWLAGWGLIGAVMYWLAGLLVMFDTVEPLSTPHIILQAPIGIQELVFAVWLIVKGFRQASDNATTG